VSLEDGLTIGARDLVLSIVRLAVADYLGVCFGHDEPGPYKRMHGNFQFEGAEFLRSSLGCAPGGSLAVSAHVVWPWLPMHCRYLADIW
jgi:hypothetical protein